MNDTEKRFIDLDLEYRADMGTVAGTCVRYGDTAQVVTRAGVFNERVLPGAFGSIGDVTLNLMHDRKRVVARTGGGGLTLADSKDRLALRCDLPPTTDGQDAKVMLDRGILRGLSVEMCVKDDRILNASRTREIRSATLLGVGIVDRPAYGDSDAVLTRFADVPPSMTVDDREDRAKKVSGTYTYGQTETVSDKGRNRKRRVRPGAFKVSIDDPQQEITLSLGRNPQNAIASKMAGTLDLKDTAKGLIATVRRPPDTQSMRDFESQVESGMDAHLVPLFREIEDGGYSDIPEPGNPDVLIREYDALKLYGLALVIREPKGAESKVDIRNRQWDSLDVCLAM